VTRRSRSIPWIVASRLLGIVIFLIVLAVARAAAFTSGNALFSTLVDFFYANLGLIIFIGILFLVAECFGVLIFPLNLPAPLFNAIASIFLVSFILRLLEVINGYYGLEILPILDVLEVLLYPLLFILVLIAGYYEIFSGIGQEEGKPVVEHPQSPPSPSSEPAAKSWDEIGSEIRQTIYDIVHRFREEINRR